MRQPYTLLFAALRQTASRCQAAVRHGILLLSLLLVGCIEPPLHLPAEDVLVDMPIVVTDMEVVWNINVD